MPLLTAAQAHARGVGLDLSDADLQSVIDDEEAQMIAKHGPHGDGVISVSEVARREGGSIFLRRAAVSVTSVTQAEYPGGTGTVLATTDYYLWPQGQLDLYPASTPYAAQYDAGKQLTVVYVPVNDLALRRSVLLELVKITTEESATSGGKVSGLGFSVDDSTATIEVGSRARAYRKLEFFST